MGSPLVEAPTKSLTVMPIYKALITSSYFVIYLQCEIITSHKYELSHSHFFFSKFSPIINVEIVNLTYVTYGISLFLYVLMWGLFKFKEIYYKNVTQFQRSILF